MILTQHPIISNQNWILTQQEKRKPKHHLNLFLQTNSHDEWQQDKEATSSCFS